MKKWMFWIGGLFLLLVVAGSTFFFSIYQTSEDILDASYEKIPRSELEPGPRAERTPPPQQERLNEFPNENFSVLFIGVDDNEHRGEAVSRADALILATYNQEDHSARLVSIPRDSYVHVPSIDRQDKIAHAHAFGGVPGTIEAVENLFEIPIDYYVRLNFHSFVDLVDAIGGVHFDVPYEIVESDSYDQRDAIRLQPGNQLLHGEEALAVVRTRKQDSDLERGERQLDMIRAMTEETFSLTTLFHLEDLMQALGTHLTTNFTPAEIHGFFLHHFTHMPTFHFDQLNGTPGHVQGAAVYHIETEHQHKLKTELQHHLGIRSS